ncbi:primosomal protein [Phycicoccus sp. BSK3Z-2]|uniref:Primosomal protein n=1 Tax=Phycicoccus avicenniae TaxID=2828860 RepID=A0A941HYV7_9MICO|nr:primosomal protein [Phycicoccus avicenniae]MBR7742267.1 primosomal protein [Phycicoccus avicenniae]
MSTDPRAALATLVTALERHLEVCSVRRGEDDPSVVAAYEDLADAFEDYDVALYEAFGEMTPLDVYGADDPDDDEDGHVDEDGDDTRIYAGLDGDYDEDD